MTSYIVTLSWIHLPILAHFLSSQRQTNGTQRRLRRGGQFVEFSSRSAQWLEAKMAQFSQQTIGKYNIINHIFHLHHDSQIWLQL